MAFNQSAIFNSWTYDALVQTASFVGKISNATYKAALYSNGITPDNTAVSASCKYNGGVWTASGYECTDATNWTAGGRGLSTITITSSAVNYVMMDAADTAGAGNVTLANVFGDLVYDDNLTTPVADQATAYHYFGGTQGVTAGTFCVGSETEILTRRGWLRYGQVHAGDECLTLNTATGAEEWQPIAAVHVFPGPHDVIRLEGAGHSSVSTPDHRWPAVVPGVDGITWYTTATLPPDAQLLIDGTDRTGKVKDLTATAETADLVWCPETPNGTWYARHGNAQYYTGNTIVWHSNGVARWTHTAA